MRFRSWLEPAFVLVVVLTGSLVAGASAIAPTRQQAGSRVCLHNQDETPEDADRRTAALRLARAINTAQSAAASTQHRYGLLEQLPNLPPVPAGFAVSVSSDGSSYAFSVKDTLDPCRFVFFSDQDGLIYTGEPLR